MGKMQGALDAHFWDQEIASPASLDGQVKALPGDPMPLRLFQSCKLPRPQQLLFMHRFVNLPVVPAYVADSQNEGGLVLERVLACKQGWNWWAALTGQFRVQKYFSVRKHNKSENSQPSAGSEQSNPLKYLFNQSLYALGFCSRIWFSQHTSLVASSEHSGNKKGWRTRAAVRHKLQQHDVCMEASWHERYVQTQGSSWDAPLSISLDLASLRSTSGLRYRLGIHHNCGIPQEHGSIDNAEIPWVASPGLCAKAAISFEKHIVLWKGKDLRYRERWERPVKPYNLCLSRPHVIMSGIIGGTFSAMLGGSNSSTELRMPPMGDQLQGNDTSNPSLEASRKKPPFSADLFTSLGCTAQYGKFQKPLLDLTKLESRLDFGSSSAFATAAKQLRNILETEDINALATDATNPLHIFNGSARDLQDRNMYPSLAIMLQQQIAGPLCARIDSRVSFDCLSSDDGFHFKEIVYGLDYSLKSLGAAKILAWYSPTRREGMVELRFLEK